MSNLELIFTIIESFIADNSLISGIHVKPETGNLLVFFSGDLPASDLIKLETEIKEVSDGHGITYNPKSYSNEKNKFVDAFVTFYEGESTSLDERRDDAFTKLKANFTN